MALGDAVAAADCRIVGKRRNGGLRVRGAPSRGEGLAEDQHVAELGDVFLFLEQVEIPAAVGGIAIEHRADDPVIPDDYALVNAAAGIAEHDIPDTVATPETARRTNVNPGQLDPG